MSSLKYWVWLSSLSGVGVVAAKSLLSHFGTPENVFKAGALDYAGVEGVTKSHISLLSDKNIEAANRLLASCLELGYRVLTLQDALYPDRLKNIYDPPIVLYVRGDLPLVDDEAVVAVVGSRSCTPYGITAAENTGYRLAQRGLVVTTGLARGVDTAAARGALKGGGRVIGVIGSGLDVTYPPENKRLFDDVAMSGAVVSEYGPGTPAVPAHFPARNRLLSGLALGVAVIEAPKKSGALITAARALEQGRDVFAMPGNIDAISCEGSNALLREGAIPVLSADDIIDEYVELFPDKITSGEVSMRREENQSDTRGRGQEGNLCEKKEIDNAPAVDYIDLDKILNALSGDEKVVAETIGASVLHTDEIIVRSGLPAHRVLTALTMLEISGNAARGNDNCFSIRNPAE